jgi:hypothetical protein
MGRMYVAGRQKFGSKKLEECGIEWRRMARNSENGRGPHTGLVPMLMTSVSEFNLVWTDVECVMCYTGKECFILYGI